jgi:thiol:disulfide interchange protein DsbD
MRRLSLFSLVCLKILFLSLFASHVHAEMVTSVVSTPQVRAELTYYAPEGIQAGQTFWLGLQLTHQKDWHTYWKNPGDSGLPTSLDWRLPQGLKANEILWPLPKKIQVGQLVNYGFTDTVLLVTPVQVDRQLQLSSSNPLEIGLVANWLVCRQECIPQEGRFKISLQPASSHALAAEAFKLILDHQPQKLSGSPINARLSQQALEFSVPNLPASWVGKRIAVFPEDAEVLAAPAETHEKASQNWSGEKNAFWNARLPLDPNRMKSPQLLSLVLMPSGFGAEPAIEVALKISGNWPSEKDLISTQAIDAESASGPASAQPVVSEDLGWWGALLGGFIGGLILNLMPCVLPVLALKVLGFTKHLTPAQRRQQAWAYALGVTASMTALGGLVMGLKQAGLAVGWGFQLQSPSMVTALAILFTLIALNLWDVFQLRTSFFAQISGWQSGHPVFNQFLSGLLVVLVAAPCTAPFMGASIGLAVGLPLMQGLLVFFMIGLGLAAPVMCITCFPRLSGLMPSPGAWMENLKRFLAFPVLATVVWLLWVLGQLSGLDQQAITLGLLLSCSGLVWALSQTRLTRLVLIMVFGLLTLVLGWYWNSNLQRPGQPTAADSPQSLWQAWSADRLQLAMQNKQPVFVDFTAAWCITCQVNERTTLARSEVIDLFKKHQVLLLKADWTRQDPNITTELKRLGRSGVPVYALYMPGQSPKVLSELISFRQIKDVLNEIQ